MEEKNLVLIILFFLFIGIFFVSGTKFEVACNKYSFDMCMETEKIFDTCYETCIRIVEDCSVCGWEEKTELKNTLLYNSWSVPSTFSCNFDRCLIEYFFEGRQGCNYFKSEIYYYDTVFKDRTTDLLQDYCVKVSLFDVDEGCKTCQETYSCNAHDCNPHDTCVKFESYTDRVVPAKAENIVCIDEVNPGQKTIPAVIVGVLSVLALVLSTWFLLKKR